MIITTDMVISTLMSPSMIISLMLSPSVATPVDVVATGCGVQAVQQAKVAALDQAHGVWISAQSRVDNGKYEENIVQYNGGVISSYEIVTQDSNCTTIKAVVIPRKDNTMTTNSESVPSSMKDKLQGMKDNYAQRQNAIQLVDNRSRAISFVTEKIDFVNSGSDTIVTIIGNAQLQKNWVAEYYELQKLAGDFELNDFRKKLMVRVNGMYGSTVIVESIFNFNNDLTLYHAHWKKNVEVYPNQSDKVRLTFKVKTDKLMSVDKFIVSFI
jgi:hypothetical protein